MTEAEWLTSDDYWQLHSHLWHTMKGRPRKYRLAGCGLFRLIRRGMLTDQERHLLELGEAFADDPTRAEHVKEVDEGDGIPRSFPYDICYPYDHNRYDSNNVSRVISYMQDRLSDRWDELNPGMWRDPDSEDDDEESQVFRQERDRFVRQADLAGANALKDIFNPFQPVALSSSWLTSTVVALATQMYEARDFSLMPILADALQDAGCSEEAVLGHCRSEGPHVRGCWVVDLVLGKE